jgi:hypothetical protein
VTLAFRTGPEALRNSPEAFKEDSMTDNCKCPRESRDDSRDDSRPEPSNSSGPDPISFVADVLFLPVDILTGDIKNK